MCRFLVYKAKAEILLSDLITRPDHSILNQSYDSRLRLDSRRPHNGDGFGIGYYTSSALGPDPCIFTDTVPAWNSPNLHRIAAKTSSELVFAHVRASTEGNLSDQNCHPFNHNSLMFMHNGNIGGWGHIKRRVSESVRDKWYMGVNGSTDSEWAFALFLDTLETMGFDPTEDRTAKGGFGSNTLRTALVRTIARINEFTKLAPTDKKNPKYLVSLLNIAVTDGHSVVCSRYVNSTTDEAASLFWSSGSSWDPEPGRGEGEMGRDDKSSDIVIIASEPLTFQRQDWVTVPTNYTITVKGQTVMLHPIKDEYWVEGPARYLRSGALACNQGQMSSAAPMSNHDQVETPAASAAVAGRLHNLVKTN